VKRRRTEIRFEVEQTLILRQPTSCPRLHWCEPCGAQVEMLRPEEAALVSGQRPRTIYRLVEANQLHCHETAEGQLLVCLHSLLRQAAD
jgi:hypothetical protein